MIIILFLISNTISLSLFSKEIGHLISVHESEGITHELDITEDGRDMPVFRNLIKENLRIRRNRRNLVLDSNEL
jgi:hypothetical protein